MTDFSELETTASGILDLKPGDKFVDCGDLLIVISRDETWTYAHNISRLAVTKIGSNNVVFKVVDKRQIEYDIKIAEHTVEDLDDEDFFILDKNGKIYQRLTTKSETVKYTYHSEEEVGIVCYCFHDLNWTYLCKDDGPVKKLDKKPDLSYLADYIDRGLCP